MPLISIEASKTAAYTVSVQSVDGSLKRLHSIYDPEGEALEIVDAFLFDGKGIIVVLGLGLGYHVAELRRRYPEADIVVVEGMPEIRDFCMTYGKAADPADRIRLIVGASPSEAVAEISKHHLETGLPPLAVFAFLPAVSAFPDYYGPIRKALDRTVSFRLWDRLRYRKFRSEALTVALFDFGYFLTEEIARAVKALGHDVVRVPGKKGESCGDILHRAIETVAAHRPDFVLTVNHLGFDEEGILANLFQAIELPAAIWYVDSPNLTVKAFDKNVSPLSHVFLWDEAYAEDMRSLGFKHVYRLPLAADETVFMPRRVSASERKKFGADIGFVGNSMVVPARDRLRKVPAHLHAAVERTARRLCYSRGCSFRQIAVEAMEPGEYGSFESLAESERADVEAAVLWRATLLYRLSCVRELEGLDAVIRGDAGWKKLLNGGFRTGPPMNYYGETPLFYNACAVNFNATNVQMGTAANQRVFDVPACGAFLLTDRQESIGNLFEEGKEVVAYRDRGEIADLAKFYLRNDAARKDIAGRGRRRVLAEHTYRHRIRTIIDALRAIG
ncbi:MAG: glycosyltransferase [Deltaproteobacteria bacterium]|nr:glycosyltransferase [Deltaproteobacteria bacterium]